MTVAIFLHAGQGWQRDTRRLVGWPAPPWCQPIAILLLSRCGLFGLVCLVILPNVVYVGFIAAANFAYGDLNGNSRMGSGPPPCSHVSGSRLTVDR